ncbi:MAG TPA: hypothetical protein PK867_06885 [Pirellulales bacterium]|nr:hypothetical protein [Pirellulales bacterium]
MITSPSARRPVDLSSLDAYADLLKSKTGIVRDDSRKKMVSVPKDSLVPMIQADVGSTVSVDVFRYRLLVPIAPTIAGAGDEFERTAVASISDIFTIEKAAKPVRK